MENLLIEIFKCPICSEVGQISGGYFNRAGDYNQWISGHTTEICKVCKGVGYIIIKKSDDK